MRNETVKTDFKEKKKYIISHQNIRGRVQIGVLVPVCTQSDVSLM